jgi:hypothetical protein
VAVLELLLVSSLAVGIAPARHGQNPLVVVPPLPSVSASPEATVPAASEAPIASPGILAVTAGDETGGTWVELVRPDTGTVSPLGLGADPAWFGDGRLVYACAKQLGENTTICMVDPAEELQPEIAGDATRPAPAPDGRLIAVHRGSIDVGETWLMRPDGTDLHRLAGGSFLQWSPDGSWLLGQRVPTFEVASSRRPGDAACPRLGYDPAWSPMAMHCLRSWTTGAVLPSRTRRDGHAPALPDQTARMAAGRSSCSSRRRPVPSGRGIGRTGAPHDRPAIRADWFGDALSVSPDGRQIAFSTGSGASARVGIASVDGGYRMLDLGTGPITQPEWAPASFNPGQQQFGEP